jgi:hypothetical protein
MPDVSLPMGRADTHALASSSESGSSSPPPPLRLASTAAASPAARFRITSPMDGDRYGLPVGDEAQYATISLRVAGPGADVARWSVDGRPLTASRWTLAAGMHVFRAVSSRGAVAEATIRVER